MAQVIFTNLAFSTLAGSITNTAVTLNLQAGGGALFPNPGAGQYFTFTMVDAATGLLNEIMWCTARTGDTLTVVRAQEGTVALPWNAGDIGSNKITAGTLNGFVQSISTTSLVHYGVAAGTNNLTTTVTPAISAIIDGTLLEITPSATNTNVVTLNANATGAASVVNRDGSTLASGTIVASQPIQLMALGGNWVLMTQPASSTVPQGALVHYGVTAGTNTLTTTVTPSISGLTDGMMIEINPGSSNTGAVTLNCNGLGYYPVVKPTGAALGSGTLIAGQPAILIYIGGNFYLMTSTGATNGGPGVGVGQWIQTLLLTPSGNTPNNYMTNGVTTATGAQLVSATVPALVASGVQQAPVNALGTAFFGLIASFVNGTPTGTWVYNSSIGYANSIFGTAWQITWVCISIP